MNVALAAAIVFLWQRAEDAAPTDMQTILDNPEIRREVVERLVGETEGIWDTHNDPDVGRVVQPEIRRRPTATEMVASNALGMRERAYALPKPEGTVRVVILGDSLVYGVGIDAADRMGGFLEQYLRERSDVKARDYEVLHLGISSWNIFAECAYLRRQLDLLRPDLVVHVTTLNDLDDNTGVRGFGVTARFSPAVRERADSLLRLRPAGPKTGNLLAHGLEFESRERYRQAREEVGRLASEVEFHGGRYVMLFNWFQFTGVVREQLASVLRADQVLYAGESLWNRREFWLERSDIHWNRAGMEAVAKLIYGAVVRHDLLPTLELEPWAEAEELLREVHDSVLDTTFEGPPFPRGLARVDHVFDARSGHEDEPYHLLGGIDSEGLVSPYASLVLRNRPSGRLVLHARPLGRRELRAASVEVWVEEHLVGCFEVGVDQPIDRSWDLPAAVRQCEYLSVRLRADDYVYVGEDLQHCVALRLDSLGIEVPDER